MPQDADRELVQRLLADADKVQVVEVLGQDEYEEWHLPGAVNLPLRKLETEASDQLDRERPVLVYCWDSA